MDRTIAQLARRMAAGGRNVVFTGAGISTESGIPDFRSQGGLWDRFKPVYYDEFMSSREARIEYWRQKVEFYEDSRTARPNKGHLAIARLHEMGLVSAVITQNIDGLHQEAGMPDDRVIELHGSNRRVRCMTCGNLYPLEETHARIEAGDPAPECDCGGYLKPDTISFGQAMPEREMERAVGLSGACDVFLAVGSTLVVQPAALMPQYAKRAGAFLAIINLSDTPYDQVCDAVIRTKAGDALTTLADKVAELTRP